MARCASIVSVDATRRLKIGLSLAELWSLSSTGADPLALVIFRFCKRQLVVRIRHKTALPWFIASERKFRHDAYV